MALPSVVLSRLVAAGKLECVAQGVYSLRGRALSEHRSLAEAALRVPHRVVCLLSSLRVHGIGSQAPFEVWMAIPPHTAVPRLDQPALRTIYMSSPALREGIETTAVDTFREICLIEVEDGITSDPASVKGSVIRKDAGLRRRSD